MNSFFTSLLSVLFFIALGYVLKQLKVLDYKACKKIFKFLFTIPLPILVFTSFASNPIESKFLLLPIIGGIVCISLVIISYFVGSAFRFDRKSIGTLMTAARIT